MNAYGAAIADASASGIALTTAINRASGARAAKRKGFDRSQMLAAAGFGKRLAGELKTLRAAQKAAGVALRACGCPLATQLADGSAWRDLRDGFVINGTPPSYAAELRRLGIPAALAQSAGLDLSTIDQLLPGTLADELDNVQELHSLDLLRTALTGWAKAVKRHPLATAPG
jgi:hypothetical protein